MTMLDRFAFVTVKLKTTDVSSIISESFNSASLFSGSARVDSCSVEGTKVERLARGEGSDGPTGIMGVTGLCRAAGGRTARLEPTCGAEGIGGHASCTVHAHTHVWTRASGYYQGTGYKKTGVLHASNTLEDAGVDQ